MRLLRLFYYLPLLLFLTTCERALLADEPELNSLTVFDHFDQLLTEKYGMFEQKGVDWEALTDAARAELSTATPEDELAEVMGGLIAQLRDGHTYLETSDSVLYGYDYTQGAPLNFDFATLDLNYFRDPVTDIGVALSAVLDGNVGYLLIDTWEGFSPADMDALLAPLDDTRGLVVDIRPNAGGDPYLAGDLARRFTDEPVRAGTEYFKTGPDPEDFSPNNIDVTPVDTLNYLGRPVAILQGRHSYSASAVLLFSTDPMPQVRTFGELSGGGTGSVASTYLLNGWTLNFSVSDFIDHRGRRLDGGVEPDEAVIYRRGIGRDDVLEAALDWIDEQ